MTLHEIRVLVAVFEENSITKAALRLNMTQPGVSQIINGIEEEYGCSLFLRSKSISPTPLCRECYENAIKVLQDYSKLETTLREESGRKEISVACDKAFNNPIMPYVRKAFKEQFPNCRLIIIEAKQDDVSSLVESGRCSFGIVQKKSGFPFSIEEETIGTDHVLCVCSKDYRLKNGSSPLTLETLSKEDLILTSKGTGIRSSLDKLAEEKSVELKPIWTCLSGDNALSFAEEGFGIAVLSETFTAKSRREGKLISIPTLFTISRTFHMIWRKDLSLSVEENFLMELCKDEWNALQERNTGK